MNQKPNKEITIGDLLTSEDPKGMISTVTFERGLALLEALVTQVESGSLPLDEALRSYERGVMLIEMLRSHLEGAEKRLEILQKSTP